jgi:hypothetical protein
MQGNEVAYSHDGAVLSFASDRILLMDPNTGEELVPFAALPRDTGQWTIRFHPREARFFTLDQEGGARTWERDPVAQAQALRATRTRAPPPPTMPR